MSLCSQTYELFSQHGNTEQMLYIVVIVGFKNFIDLFDAVCTLVAYIAYNMGNRGNWDLLDILCPRPCYKYICVIIYRDKM